MLSIKIQQHLVTFDCNMVLVKTTIYKVLNNFAEMKANNDFYLASMFLMISNVMT
jgi:hypothetical protein